MTDQTNIQQLLHDANQLMMQDLDEEYELLKHGPWTPVVHPEKYDEARDLFEQVLKIDPDNQTAKDGIEACDAMLEEYHPVQYMAPVDNINIIPASIEPLPPPPWEIPSTVEQISKTEVIPQLMPWDIRRKKLNALQGRDRAGIEYTINAFAAASERYRQDVQVILETARQKLSNTNSDEVYALTKIELENLQERAHQGWKGHGPEFLEDALSELRRIIGSM